MLAKGLSESAVKQVLEEFGIKDLPRGLVHALPLRTLHGFEFLNICETCWR